MQELVKLMFDNGVAISVCAYFMYRDFKFQSTLLSTLQTLVDTVDTLKLLINNENEKEV